MSSAPNILTPEEWSTFTCHHIDHEGQWPVEMLDRQLMQFPSWSVSMDAQGGVAGLFKRYSFADFKAVIQATSLLNELADKEDHHPVAVYSYNYVEVTWSTHSANGVSNNDWACAAKLDRMLSNLG